MQVRSSLPSICAAVKPFTKSMVLAMRACSSRNVVSVSGKLGTSTPARRAMHPLAASEAIWTCRARASMSGASRAFTKTAGSIFLASAWAAPLARMAARFSSPRTNTGPEAWYIESVIGVGPRTAATNRNLVGCSRPFYRALNVVLCARHPLGGRVFEMQRLARMDQRIDAVRGHRGLGEAAQDELQLAGIARDVADGEDAGRARRTGLGRDRDMVVVEVEAPTGDRPEIHREAEERQQHIGLQLADLAVEGRDIDGAELAVRAFERMQLVGHHQLDLPLLRQLLHARDRFRRAAELRAAVDDVKFLSDAGKRQGPVERGIAAAGDHHALAAHVLLAFHQVEDALALELGEALQRRAVGAEGTDTGGDDDGAGVDPGAGRGLQVPAVADLGQLVDLLAEMVHGMERRGLLLQLLDQVGGIDRGIAGDVVDRLLGVQRGALPAGGLKRVDDVALHFQHAAFEHREQADRARTDDRHVRYMRRHALLHIPTLSVPESRRILPSGCPRVHLGGDTGSLPGGARSRSV